MILCQTIDPHRRFRTSDLAMICLWFYSIEVMNAQTEISFTLGINDEKCASLAFVGRPLHGEV